MVKIVKGNLVNTVPKSAFHNYFASQGWQIVEGDFTPSKPVIEEVEPIVVVDTVQEADEEWDEVLDELQDEEVEKPLSELNKDQLIEKANSLGINIDGLTTNKQLREAIKAAKK